MKIHVIWLAFSICLACAVYFVTYNFTREAMLATQVGFYVTENKIYDNLLESVNRDDKHMALLTINAMRTHHSQAIDSLTEFLDAGYFPGTTHALLEKNGWSSQSMPANPR